MIKLTIAVAAFFLIACCGLTAAAQCPSSGVPEETFGEIQAYVGRAAAYEGNAAHRGGIYFSVTLSGCLTEELVVVWETRDGTARGSTPGADGQPGVCGPGDDYEGRRAGEIIFPAGHNHADGHVLNCQDNLIESTETYTVALVGLRSGGQIRQGVFDMAEIGIHDQNTLREAQDPAPHVVSTAPIPPTPPDTAPSRARNQVQTMYVAYYGRPGDVGGLDYWAEKLEEAGGGLEEIIDAFGNSMEFQDRFGDLDNEEVVNNIFLQLLGRDADSEGLNFYLGGLQAGRYTLASIALDVADGTKGLDAMIKANKLWAANTFTEAYVEAGAAYGKFQIDDAKLWLAEVDSAGASIIAALDRLPDLLEMFPRRATSE